MTAPTVTALEVGRALLEQPARFVSLTPVQRAAFELYNMGFSIGPTRPASKLPYLWRRLVTTRIDPAAIPELFPGRQGLFVVTGAISRNLAVVDCETPEAASHIGAEFARRGLRPWIVTTARGAHYWFLSADGELANQKDDGRGWELRGRTLYVMAPPSIHPTTGLIYDYQQRDGEHPPAYRLDALDWLGAELHAKARRKPASTAPEAYPELSRANREFILSGAAHGERNNRLFAAACDLAGNGYSLTDARRILAPSARLCGLPDKDTRASIACAYRKARTPAKTGRTAPPMPAWALARHWADGHTFTRLTAERTYTGKDGKPKTQTYRVSATTARGVFIGLCERARREHPSTTFRASVREVSELARVTKDTAQAAIVCLLAAGLLEPCGYNPAGAGLFAFSKAVFHNQDSKHHWSLSTVPVMKHAAWARGGLGETARRVWTAILAAPARAADVARQVNVSRATAGRTLAALEGYRLAQRGAGGLWEGIAAASADLDTVAAARGVFERDTRRKALHERQRAADVTLAILRRLRASDSRCNQPLADVGGSVQEDSNQTGGGVTRDTTFPVYGEAGKRRG